MPIELAELLSPERTRFVQALPSKKRAFELLAGLLSDNPDSPFQQQHIFDQLLHRERLGNTAIGGGIALPRARADISQVRAALLIVNQGISQPSPDKKPVFIFLSLLLPDNDSQSGQQLIKSLVERLSSRPVLYEISGVSETAIALNYFETLLS